MLKNKKNKNNHLSKKQIIIFVRYFLVKKISPNYL